MTVGELARSQQRHERDSDRTHRDIMRLLHSLDERTDRLTIRVAVILAVASVAWAVLLAIAPFVRAVLGMPNG